VLTSAECEQTLQERTADCKKLSASLEQQQGSVLCKINDLNETYNLDKKQSEAIIAHLQESEKELIDKVAKLQQVSAACFMYLNNTKICFVCNY